MGQRMIRCGILLMGVATSLAAGENQNGSDPQVSALAKEVHDKGWIAYGARSPKGDWDLFLCRPDGSDVRNITNTPEYSEGAPRFSPDNKKMLYRRTPKGTKISHDQWGFQGELVIASADGSSPAVVGKEGELTWASWSPDGKQVSVLTKKGIRIVDLATRKVAREIPRKGMYQQLFWSPDGKWFCGVSNFLGEQWTVARMSVETGEINAVNSFQNCTPDWFPDSKWVIFSHRPKGQEGKGWTQLWMADGDGKNRKLLYGQDGLHVYGGATSPDGKYILFTTAPFDGGGSEKDGAPIHVARLADTPMIMGESKDLRKLHSDTKGGPVLDLPVGWEPHWTYADVKAAE
jgi:Tol biopolymer transport system component